MKLLSRFGVSLAVLALGACSYSTPMAPEAPPRGKGVFTGTVTYRERSALPANALVTVRVWDAMEPPESATVGQTQFVAQGQVPFQFELFFDSALIQSSHTYGARASITVEGVVWFETQAPVPVLTQGAPSVAVELVVQRVAKQP
jgi:putative lipoprotein